MSLNYTDLADHIGHFVTIQGVTHQGVRTYVNRDLVTTAILHCFTCKVDIVTRDYDHWRIRLIAVGLDNGYIVPADIDPRTAHYMIYHLENLSGWDEDGFGYGVDELAEAEGWEKVSVQS